MLKFSYTQIAENQSLCKNVVSKWFSWQAEHIWCRFLCWWIHSWGFDLPRYSVDRMLRISGNSNKIRKTKNKAQPKYRLKWKTPTQEPEKVIIFFFFLWTVIQINTELCIKIRKGCWSPQNTACSHTTQKNTKHSLGST